MQCELYQKRLLRVKFEDKMIIDEFNTKYREKNVLSVNKSLRTRFCHGRPEKLRIYKMYISVLQLSNK